MRAVLAGNVGVVAVAIVPLLVLSTGNSHSPNQKHRERELSHETSEGFGT